MLHVLFCASNNFWYWSSVIRYAHFNRLARLPRLASGLAASRRRRDSLVQELHGELRIPRLPRLGNSSRDFVFPHLWQSFLVVFFREVMIPPVLHTHVTSAMDGAMRDRYPDMKKPKRFDPSQIQADEIKLFPPLAAEPDNIVGYMRTGGCTLGCGACCTAFIIPINSDGIEADDFEHVVCGRLNVPVDPIVIGKTGTDDWERWLRLHDTTIFKLPSGVLVADLPVEIEKTPGAMTVDEWCVWLEKQGVAMIQREGQQVLAYITRKCDELGEDGLCQLFGTPDRPQMCGGYPAHATDVQGIGFCTYNFSPVDRAEIMARNIIGQGRPKARPKKKGKRKKRGRR